MPAPIHLNRPFDDADPDWTLLAGLIARASHVSVLTGAGISAESGLPTFRAGGLWETHRFEDVATPQAFARDPRMVWRFYNHRRDLLRDARPNDAHRAIAALEKARPGAVTVITQNVDGLHHDAGTSNIIELHGNLRTVRCTRCDYQITGLDPLSEEPRCACGALLRPGVVWFGERLPAHAIDDATRAIRKSDVLLVIGTSAAVYPAAGLIHIARDQGCFVIESNLMNTEASTIVHAHLRGNAAAMIPPLLQASLTLHKA